MKQISYFILTMLILFTFSACGAAPGTPVENTPVTVIGPTLTPEAAATPGVIVVTSGPAVTVVAVPAETSPAGGTPAPLTFPPGGGLIVGLQDQGKTVVMHVGDRFLLQLGEVFDWTVTSSDDTVVGRVINVMVIKGAQGLYEGRKAGEATLNAVGDPLCRTSTPACMVPSISYTLHVQVIP